VIELQQLALLAKVEIHAEHGAGDPEDDGEDGLQTGHREPAFAMPLPRHEGKACARPGRCPLMEASLERFVQAQEPVIERVLAELCAGRKSSHWMWFVFPQLAGLGHSPMAQRFAIASRAEAKAYLAHPVLGPRLRECTRLVNEVEGHGIEEIFGHPDYLKFRSCMTLFVQASPEDRLFADALRKYFAGEYDPLTLERLGRAR